MAKVTPQPVPVDIDFTDAQLTGQGGLAFLAQLARETGLLEQIAQRIRLKQRRRGASDAEMLWSLVASLASGNGALSDLDALRQDPATAQLLGLGTVPSGRRLGEYLTRMGETQLQSLQSIARHLARQVAPTILAHQVETLGYVPVFVDGTAIKVDGRLFEGAGKGYDGSLQYWLHGVFVGGLWASGRLHPGGVDVAAGWREQLAHDVAPLLGDRHPVWLHADNAYYRGDLIRFCRERGWDYSISVTNDGYRRPILDSLEGLPESAWTDIGGGETATLAYHRPAGWPAEQAYVVVRRWKEGRQKALFPVDTIILVSRDDLPLAELVARHRGKQGQENAFKGPLIDMDLHHPPCRRFQANQAFYLCGQLAQMLLRGMQYRVLPHDARRHGLRPLIRYGIRAVARLVHTGRRWRLDFSKNAFRLDWLLHASLQLE